MSNLVTVDNLTIPGILNNISFAIAPGERVGLIGESGSGKSMTAMTIMGLLHPSLDVQGTVLVKGQEPSRALRGLSLIHI